MSERPSAIEFMKQAAETDRLKENSRRTQEITKKLVENSGVFGGQIEEERSQVVCQEVLAVFGSKYESVRKMEEIAEPSNASSTDRQKAMATENLGVLGTAAFRAINFSFKEYPEGLITSALTAEQIDDFLPEEMKGLGKFVVEADKKATDEERKAIFEMDFPGDKNNVLNNENGKNHEATRRSEEIVRKKTGKEDDSYTDVRGEIKEIDFNNRDQVLEYSRELLDYLENSNYPSEDLNISGETTKLLNYILNKKIIGKDGFEIINKEIKARLALHDTAIFMTRAGGSLSDRSNESIPNIMSKIAEHDRFLTRDVMRFFFDNEGSMGVPFTKAWDLLQDANFNYRDMLKRAGLSEDRINVKFREPVTSDRFFGQKYTNYEYDTKEADKEMVYSYMLEQLGGGEKARKALQLAQKMFVATDEASVVNVGFIGGDDFSEAIHFGRFREDDAKPGKTKNAGPDVHRGWIKSLTPGWLRNFSNISDPDKRISAEAIRTHLDNLEGKKDFYTYHSVIVGKKTGPLKELLLDKSLKKPEEIVELDFFKSKIDLFNKLDKDNKKGLRAYWVAGLLQSNMMNRSNLWDADHISALRKILTRESLTLKGQKEEFFLTNDEWKWVVKSINLNRYFRMDFIADVIGDMYKIKKKR
ncbi:MAG TPA: hypothetical protein PK257_02370 [Candidatus Woesebacteria bacterium]|nr:hypothetical protein [Candidatus Woesebacteria bacterium]